MYEIPTIKLKLIKEKNEGYVVNKINSPEDTFEIANAFLNNADRENLIALFLDTKNNVIGIHTISIGTLNASLVHPREVFKAAIIANSAKMILVHNHPSGDPYPSKEDIKTTTKIVEAGDLLEIKVIDHVIIGNTYISLKEEGVIRS